MAGSLLNLRNRKTIKKKKEMKSAHMRNPQLQILFSSGMRKVDSPGNQKYERKENY